jgi:transposase
MEFTYFVGIDVSKNELDFAVFKQKEFLFHKEIANNHTGIDAFIKELKKLPEFDLKKAIFCMEHTGIYNIPLLEYLHQKKGNIWLENALQIKNSLGNIRGKNDKVDAKRMGEYAYKNREELRLWQPKRETIQELSYLTAQRNRLVNAKKQLEQANNETQEFIKKSIQKKLKKYAENSLKGIVKDLAAVEKEIKNIIDEDEELKRLFAIVSSIKGVGEVTATQIIIATNEFKDIDDPKKFACYAGVAPFVKESGIFRGKAKVSPMANKSIKTLLHLNALSAIQYDAELKAYYERKTEVEKKNKMLVINAVRNKLILRIFACVKQNRKFQKDYQRKAA